MSALLFFDIDGTLITLDQNHVFPESTKNALNKARENGHRIFINTGRVKTAIDKQLLDFGFDGLICGCGTYIEFEGKELLHETIAKDKCIDFAKKLHDYGYETLFEGKERLFIDGDYAPGTFMNYIYDYFSGNSDYPIERYDHPQLIYDKFTTCQLENSDSEAFLKTFESDFHLIPHGFKVIEVVPDGYSKATGIQFIMNELDVSQENCYAFGDSVNDLEMLKYVKHSVGMGNGVNDVLELCEYVTTDIEEDGIANALKHYRLV